MAAPMLENVDTITILLLGIIGGVLAVITAIYLTLGRVLKASEGDGIQVEIAGHIREGAIAFLTREYSVMGVFVIVMLVVLGLATGDWVDAVPAFIVGAILSGTCGWLGMLIAVTANVRTCEAAAESLNNGLKVAFASGAVMGLSVCGSGILGLCIFYGIFGGLDGDETSYIAGLGFGASAIALFARVGGGIYTKAADVGADLVGKVEANIPEDDPRNPATIADNVGDNVGDVAGMGADLFESFVGSIVASIQLASSGFDTDVVGEIGSDDWNDYVARRIALPFWIAGFGIICSIIGIFLVRTGSHDSEKTDVQERLLSAIRFGIFFAAFLSAGTSLLACWLLFGTDTNDIWELWGCVLIGLVAGLFIGTATEYVTSFAYMPTKSIANKTLYGPAGVIIQGWGVGMLSTSAPVIIIFITILAAYELAESYGIAISAVGMLATLGVTLATDAFGPVADNAGGIAEMAELDPEVRDRTDSLDALGNTTAATGKGFAIGSAVLTSIALLQAFTIEVGLVDAFDDSNAVDLLDSSVLAGAILGAMLPYIFAALTMLSVGRCASVVIQEVRRQFHEIEGLLDGKEGVKAQYGKCVAICTQSSIREMIVPGLLAIVAPLFTGLLIGPAGLTGLLVGAIISGFMLAIAMANAGGAWDNAKKFVEAEGMGAEADGMAKGSDLHHAAIVGDTVGDPFKDTSGPSLNILIKLMSMISLVFAPIFTVTDETISSQFWIAIIILVVFVLISAPLLYWLDKEGEKSDPIKDYQAQKNRRDGGAGGYGTTEQKDDKEPLLNVSS